MTFELWVIIIAVAVLVVGTAVLWWFDDGSIDDDWDDWRWM